MRRAKVHLEDSAIAWSCPRCDARNFFECEIMEPSTDMCDEVRVHGESLIDYVGLRVLPDAVQCGRCESVFDIADDFPE